MQKLRDRFETIFKYSSRPHELEAANEAKKIAIAFLLWVDNWDNVADCKPFPENCDNIQEYIHDKLFDKFVEEYYSADSQAH